MRPLSVKKRVESSALVYRFMGGDEEAFRQLYNQHVRYIGGIIYSITGKDRDLDDLLQEAFLQAYRSRATLREAEKFTSWLSTIAVRITFKYLKKRRRFSLFSIDPEPLVQEEPPHGDLLLRHQLYDALERLSPDLRVPFVLHRVDEFTLPEVSRLCQISLATTKRRIKKATELMKKRVPNG